ncbi:lipoprotein insertase outer membrane protein LolB [Chromatiaceae bacterium AAb-1]|nr:lipoprotein insertase outer membrane protein LolB [Chromatiaceae bacterium AAb-1]
MSEQIKPLLSMILITFLLTGCTLFSGKSAIQQQPLDAAKREQQLLLLNQFSLQASLGVRTPDENISGNLSWQQHNSSYQARLNNFLGISLFELNQTPTGSDILIRGEHYYDTDAGSLLLQLSGWSIPLTDMPLWLKGLPGENSADIEYDEHGRAIAFVLTDSNGIRWQLQYLSFFNDAMSLPKTLQLHSTDTRIKLVIRNWQFL